MLFFIAAMTISPQEHASIEWSKLMRRDHPPRAVATGGDILAYPTDGSYVIENGDSRILVNPGVVEREIAANKIGLHVGSFFQQNLIQKADDCLRQGLKERPDLRRLLIDLSADCDLLLGKYGEGYDLVATQISDPGSDTTERELRLSLASAGGGEIYPGQMEYCDHWLRKNYADQHGLRALQAKPESVVNPHTVMVMSALALGMHGEDPYLELAIELDPTNKIAAREAILRYTYRGRYADIRRVASAIVAKLPPGPDREEFRSDITKVANLRDKPQHYIDEDRNVIHP